ncbi:Crp/Fnr family transcriptional regulator [Variovorax sp. dw_308]|uniref:Crp/Fnr family transcriptional regulator n=1 Tax=Variovorax sp. dw_308 TaxID=2721546 RepID=UPI001C43B788|nr:Crp/Fnr family transcriptional regulator [Variovorax sp. dw_308]
MTNVRNRLIAGLPAADQGRLLAMCEPFELVLSEVLCETGMPTFHAYFPVEGFISLVSMIDQSPGVEVGMVGSEGMLGAQLALGVSVTPLRALVQGPGTALRISAPAFRKALKRSPELQHAILRYVHVLMTQLATSSACLRFHMIGPRLARWLLMSQDRAQSTHFHVTQEFLAYMLGVRRVGITAAAGALQRSGLIVYHRGDIEVLDRKGLEAAACGCYAAECRAYEAFLH